jgi:hypothetical protein
MNAVLLLCALLGQLITDTVRYPASMTAPRINLVGSGSNGTDPTGPVVLFEHSAPSGYLLGSGNPFRATGNLVSGVRIVRQGSGGTALAFVATSAAERPGEIVIQNTKIGGWRALAGGETFDGFDCGVLFDGRAVDIRRVHTANLRIFDCAGDSLIVRNVTHFYSADLEVDKGAANRVPNVIVENSRHVRFYGAEIFGEIHFRGCDQVRFDGYAQIIRIDKACSNVIVTSTCPKILVERGGKSGKSVVVNGWGMP